MDMAIMTAQIHRDIETVDSFCYLGAIINNRGSCEEEIRSRICQARSAMSSLGTIWKDTGITRNTKIRLTKTLVFSIMTYGCESWSMTKADRDRVNAFEMWIWRRMLRVLWTAKRTNTSILEEIKPGKRLIDIIKYRILKYFGHISRREDSSIEKTILFGKTDGARRPGRPKGRWLDQVKT
jgi:hypothetical protein